MINTLIQQMTEKGNQDVDAEFSRSPLSIFSTIDSLSISYTQKKVSLLDIDIINAIHCDKTKARYLAKRACKVWCLWLELYTKKIIGLSFEEFFKVGVDQAFIHTDNCKLLLEQRAVYTLLRELSFIKSSTNFNFIEVHNLHRFRLYEPSTPWSGTVRIETGKDEFHSIPAYNLNGDIKISDISYRGTRVPPWQYITSENFRYFTMFKEV